MAAAPAGFHVVPGVAAYGALEARRWTEQAAEAGCPAVMLLPPNAYRADAESVVAHYREVAKAGLPIVAYNNPIDTKVDLTPTLLARLHGEGLIVAVKEFTGDVRRAYEIAETGARSRRPRAAPTTSRSSSPWPARRAGSRAFPTRCRASARRCGRRPARGPGRRGAGLPAAASVAALGFQDRVRAGDQALDGPGRPLRRPVPAAARAAIGRAGRGHPPRHRVRHAGRRDRGGSDR